jgi:uncharacterized repeat protein (TIGR01451 family)
MKKINLVLSLLLSLFNTHLFSQHEEKFINKKNELSFEENKGQMKDQNWKSRPDVLYSGSSEGMNFYIKNSGMSYQLSRVESWKEEDNDMLRASLGSDDKKRQVPDQIGTYRVDAEWLNANKDFTINRGNALEGYNNYYNVPEGVEPALFVKKYETLTLLNVWNGVDIHYYGNGGFLETDYIVAPGADYHQIQIDIKGAELSTDDQGNLILKTPFGEIREGQLKVYQNDVLIEATWKIKGNRVSFDIPNYNPNIAMVIDPLTRVWGTYYGGNNWDMAGGIEIDQNENIIISGWTNSLNIITINSHQNTNSGGVGDAFVTCYSKFGNILWSTYYGGSLQDIGTDITIDSNGDVYLSGYTNSVTNIALNGIQNNLTGSDDAFIAKFNIQGILLWGTYYGGSGSENETLIASDGYGNVYLAGITNSTNIIGFNGFQNTYGGGISDAFLVKLNSTGSILWSTYFGGIDREETYFMCSDYFGNISIGGGTYGIGINLLNSFQSTFGGGWTDGFVAKFNTQGTLLLSSLYGGSGDDYFYGGGFDNQNNLYLAGTTSSMNNISSNLTTSSFLGGAADGFVVKFSPSGGRIWSKYFGGNGGDNVYNLNIDTNGKILCTGKTTSPLSIAQNGFQQIYGGNQDCFFTQFDTNGTIEFGSYYGGNLQDYGWDIKSGNDGDFYVYGKTNSANNFASSTSQNAFGGGLCDVFLAKFKKPLVSGRIFNDINSNCLKEFNEPLLSNNNVIIQPGNLIVQSQDGIWFIDSLAVGSYSATIDTTNLNWNIPCPITQYFNVLTPYTYYNCADFALTANNLCSNPEITIIAPNLTRCFSNQIVYVHACNDNSASASLDSSFVIVTLDTLLTVNSASLPFTALGNNVFQFQTGTLNPGQCVDFTLSTTVSCNATLGQTLCMNAELFPVENCALDTLPSGPNWDNIPSEGALGGLPQPCLDPWDQSSLSVDGWCQNDSIYFTVTNTGVLGGGDMECYAPVWLTVNGVVTFTDSIMLQGGQTITYAFEGNGQTWILNASQHPLHPGNSQPNAFVERCGNAANWTPGEVNDYPQDDADPVIDIYCEEVSGSYDPNDKRGYPNGVTNMNYIQPNQQLQYVIRFQNTGTDTAFTVVIRDTLDLDLNIFTVTPGVSSHNYEFRMYGPRVLEWTFNNINLPDSTIDQVGSNGFVTFHVEQNPNLSPGTVITNDADIYFDFNDPITTNTTIHRIYEGFPNVLSLQDLVNNKESIVLYPNPTPSEITITSDKFTNEPYTLFDQMGRTVSSGKLSGTTTTISLSTLTKGIYILKVEGDYESAIVVKE